MSEQKNKIWADGITSLKARKLEFGTILNVGIKVDQFVEFLNKNKNEKGYVNLNIMKRKELGQYGDTHNCSLDTWTPKTQTAQAEKPVAVKKVVKPTPQPVESDANDF